MKKRITIFALETLGFFTALLIFDLYFKGYTFNSVVYQDAIAAVVTVIAFELISNFIIKPIFNWVRKGMYDVDEPAA